MDYAALRMKMVREQLLSRGIRDKRVLAAFEKVERHKFIPDSMLPDAYADFPLPIGENQTISQPYMVALMTENLCLNGKEKILEIGTGSGYQTAILAELAKEVCTIERLEHLSKKAQTTLEKIGYDSIKYKVGDGTLGWPEEAPFDRVIITAASPQIPLPLTEQLKENGRMVIPLGETLGQVLTLVEKKENKLEAIRVCGCVFVPLIGKYGYKEKEKIN